MKFHKLLEGVRDLLFHEWDPIGVNDNLLCREEYDSYAATIARFLREGADENKILAHLTHLQRVSMGLLQIDQTRDLQVTRQLINLVKKP